MDYVKKIVKKKYGKKARNKQETSERKRKKTDEAIGTTFDFTGIQLRSVSGTITLYFVSEPSRLHSQPSQLTADELLDEVRFPRVPAALSPNQPSAPALFLAVCPRKLVHYMQFGHFQ